VGANRIVPSVAIPHPLGEPGLEDGQEHRLRRALLERALVALETPLERQHVFD
jgi:glycine reductase